MPRLIRPPISVEVKCRVVLRQLGEMFIDEVIAFNRRKLGALLAGKLDALASLLNCERAELRCDHDPALGARQKVFRHGVHVDYVPAGSDPAHLYYRPHGPRFAGSHLIKTNIRGDHGQHPDRVLIKKNRRLERRLAEEPRRRKTMLIDKPTRKPKARFSRPLRSANRWPPKGSQKIRGRS